MSRMPEVDGFSYMSPLYPKDKTLVLGCTPGSRSVGQTTSEPPVVHVHVLVWPPFKPWTRTRLGSVGVSCVWC